MRVFRSASHASHPTASWSRGRFARLFFIVATHNWFFLPTERREKKTPMRCLKPGPECFYSRWRSPVVDRTHADQDTAVPKSYYGGSGYCSVPPLYYPEPNGYPGSGGYYNGPPSYYPEPNGYPGQGGQYWGPNSIWSRLRFLVGTIRINTKSCRAMRTRICKMPCLHWIF